MGAYASSVSSSVPAGKLKFRRGRLLETGRFVFANCGVLKDNVNNVEHSHRHCDTHTHTMRLGPCARLMFPPCIVQVVMCDR